MRAVQNVRSIDPLVHLGKRVKIDRQKVIAALDSSPQDSGSFQHPNVLRHGVERHSKRFRPIGYSRLALDKSRDNRPPCAIRECRQDCVHTVSCSGPNGTRDARGWSFKWVPSYRAEFNLDYHVSFTPEEVAHRGAFYHFTMQDPSAAVRDEHGRRPYWVRRHDEYEIGRPAAL